MPADTAHDLRLELPKVDGTRPDQDAEWCEVTVDGSRRRVRFHDYDEIFRIPGLYEAIFYETLKCNSPNVVADRLLAALEVTGEDPADHRILDVGAGNGMVAEELRNRGFPVATGCDLLQEAADAAERDRPGLYRDYVVCDLTDLNEDQHRRLVEARATVLTTVAALGFGDIPCQAFAAAFDVLEVGGWMAFNIKADFLAEGDRTGFHRMVERMLAEGVLEEFSRDRYVHRLSMDGRELPYVAIVARKRQALPQSWVEDC